MGKRQETPQLAWGGMASGGLGAAAPVLAFSLEDAPQLATRFFTSTITLTEIPFPTVSFTWLTTPPISLPQSYHDINFSYDRDLG